MDSHPGVPELGYLRPERPLAVRLYRPAGPARAGVVLCPPIGLEEFQARRTLHELAGELSSAGALVLSLDYDGTSDSAGTYLDPHRIAAWQDSIVVAGGQLQKWGLSSLTLVGLRTGALLAAQVAATLHADSVVLWDPVTTGRAFLRAQQFLTTAGLFGADPPPPPTDGSVEGPGLVLSHDSAAEVRVLSVRHAPVTTADVLVVHRGAALPAAAAPDWPAARLTTVSTDEATALFDVDTTESQVPRRALGQVLAWIVGHWGDGSGSIDADRLALAHEADMGGVRDTATRLGRSGLAAVVTTPLLAAGAAADSTTVRAGSPGGAPTFVFLNSGVDHRSGPGRLWVDLSREWAAMGLRTVRLDLAGLGDSPSDIEEPVLAYPRYAVPDLASVAAELAGPMVLIGLCSGGYHALEAAVHVDAAGVLALNPYLGVGGELDLTPGDDRTLLRATRGPHRLRRNGYVLDRLPMWAWRVLALCGLHTPPSALLEAAHGSTPNVLVLLGEADAYPLTRRGGWHLRAVQSAGIDVRRITGLDHGLLLAAPRQELGRVMTDYVRSHWVTAAA